MNDKGEDNGNALALDFQCGGTSQEKVITLQLPLEVGETGVLWKATFSNLGMSAMDGDEFVRWKPAAWHSDSI